MTDPKDLRLADLDFDMDDARICGVIERALPHTGISILYQDNDLKYLWTRNLHPAFSQTSIAGLYDPDILPQAEAERLTELKKAAIASGESRSIELQLDHGMRTNWFHVIIEPEKDEHGLIGGLVTTIIDTTDQKRREQTLSTLLREVSHRSKNLLAIILSIAAQTGRYSRNVDVFLARFRGRIQSLAYSQDLVTSSNWRGAALRDLIAQQTSRYSADAGNIHFEGLNVNLNPNATLHIGLGLHELAVNSVSFGALSRPDGMVSIVSALGEGGALHFRWTERLHAASPAMIGERRFGSVALERVVPAAVNGAASLTIENGVLDYALKIPPDQFEPA